MAFVAKPNFCLFGMTVYVVKVMAPLSGFAEEDFLFVNNLIKQEFKR